jgi:hypothetical protein
MSAPNRLVDVERFDRMLRWGAIGIALSLVGAGDVCVSGANRAQQFRPGPGAPIHQSDPGAFMEDGSGFLTPPRCACGWEFGPVPDMETFVDVLMAHAAEEAERGSR